MDEASNNNFYRQVQISRNSDAIRAKRDYDVSTATSSGLIGHCMGRHLHSVGVLYQKEKDVTGLSFTNAKVTEQNIHDDGTRQESSPINDKHYVFASKKDDQEKIAKNKHGKKKRKKKAIPVKKDRESLHVWGVCPQRQANITTGIDIRRPPTDNELESRKNTSAAVVSFERCINRRRIQDFEPSFGELFRVGSLVSTSGASTWTSEEPTTPCRLVFPNRFLTQKLASYTRHTPMYIMSESNGLYETNDARNSSSMLVEKIKDKRDRYRIASSVYHILRESEELDIIDLADDMECIKEFGFNHIIVVGERDYGILFLDCYGRIFDWDHINFLLWPLGNYLENRLDEPKNLAWGVDNGIITEFEVDPQDKHRIIQ